MAEHLGARAAVFGAWIWIALATTAATAQTPGSTSVPAAAPAPTDLTAAPDAPSDKPAAPGAAGDAKPARQLPFDYLVPKNPADSSDLDDVDTLPADPTGGADLDAIPALGEPPAPAAGTDTNPDAGNGVGTAATGSGVPGATPEPQAEGPGLESFYTAGQGPGFVNGTNDLTLPYTVAPSVGIGRARTRIGPFRMGLNLSASTAYDSNVFGTNHPLGDVVSSITPSLYIQTGTRGTFRLLYTPTFSYYSKYTTQNAENQTLLASSTYKFTKLSIGGDFGYTTRNGLFPTANGNANQDTYNLSLHADYRLTAKTQLHLSYSGSVQESNPGGTQVTNEVTFSTGHPITHRLSGGGSLTVGYQDSQEGGGQQPYVTLGVVGTWMASTSLQVSGNAGVQARSLDAGQGGKILVSPVFDISATWSHPGYPTLGVDLFRDVGGNAFDTVSTDITTGALGTASVTLWKKIGLSASGGLSYYEQEGNQSGSQSSNYTYATGVFTVGYAFRSFLNLNLFCNFQQRLSQSAENNYQTTLIGLSVGTNF